MNTRVARQRRSRPTKYLKFELPLKYLTSLASLRGPGSTRSPFNPPPLSSLLSSALPFSKPGPPSSSSCSRKRFEEAGDRVGIEPIREIERKETGNGGRQRRRGRRHVISRRRATWRGSRSAAESFAWNVGFDLGVGVSRIGNSVTSSFVAVKLV